MKKKTLNNGEMLDASLEATLAVELFLNENYLFRRNVLNGKVEFLAEPSGKAEYVTKNPESAADQTPEDALHWRPLTQEALNSIIRRAKKEQVCEKGSPKTEIVEFVHSEDVPAFNPVNHYLSHLPEWDGQNHIAKLLSRLPGLTTEQQGFFATWLRSAVAHWKQMDTLHGNECVPMLIGEQGCGKTTFFKRLLPPSLRECCLDHLNLSNKFDKEMALTNNMLVILDEFDNVVGHEEDLLINATTIALDEAPLLASKYGGICYPAHIDRPANGAIEILGDFPHYVGFHLAELHDRSNKDAYVRDYHLEGIRLLFSSDAHYLDQLREGEDNDWFEIDDSLRGEELIRKHVFDELRLS